MAIAINPSREMLPKPQVIVAWSAFLLLNNKFGHKINSYIPACRNYDVNRYTAAIGINRTSFVWRFNQHSIVCIVRLICIDCVTDILFFVRRLFLWRAPRRFRNVRSVSWWMILRRIDLIVCYVIPFVINVMSYFEVITVWGCFKGRDLVIKMWGLANMFSLSFEKSVVLTKKTLF